MSPSFTSQTLWPGVYATRCRCTPAKTCLTWFRRVLYGNKTIFNILLYEYVFNSVLIFLKHEDNFPLSWMMYTSSISWDYSVRAKMIYGLEFKYTSFEHIRSLYFIMEKTRLLRYYTMKSRKPKPAVLIFPCQEFLNFNYARFSGSFLKWSCLMSKWQDERESFQLCCVITAQTTQQSPLSVISISMGSATDIQLQSEMNRLF